MEAGGIEHLMRFPRVHGEPCLGEHVLVGVQGRDDEGLVHVRPRADADCVGVVGLDELEWVVVYRWDAKLVRDALCGRAATVCDGDDPNAVKRLKAGQVHLPRVLPCPNDANAKCVHARIPLCSLLLRRGIQQPPLPLRADAEEVSLDGGYV